MFKKSLYFILAIALIFAFPFNIYAHNLVDDTSEANIPNIIEPQNLTCLLRGHTKGEEYFVDATAGGPDEDYCFYDIVETVIVCARCDEPYEYLTYKINCISHDPTTILEDASGYGDYGEYAYLETTYCDRCNYILRQRVIYYM